MSRSKHALDYTSLPFKRVEEMMWCVIAVLIFFTLVGYLYFGTTSWFDSIASICDLRDRGRLLEPPDYDPFKDFLRSWEIDATEPVVASYRRLSFGLTVWSIAQVVFIGVCVTRGARRSRQALASASKI